MSNFVKYLRYYFSFFTNHPVCCVNTLLVALSAGGEQLFETVSFKCPKDWSLVKEYALISLLCPFAALLILGILGSNLTHRLCLGLKGREEKVECSNCCSSSTCYYIFAIIGRALLIPSAWVFVSLMDGDLYACYYWKPNCLNISGATEVNATIPCTFDPDADEKINKISSQKYAWFFLVVTIGLTGIFSLVGQCYASRTHVHSLYADVTQAAEKEQMEKLMKGRAEELAIRNVTTLMLDENLKEKDWQDIALEVPTSNLGKFHSPLQEWVSKRVTVGDPNPKATNVNVQKPSSVTNDNVKETSSVTNDNVRETSSVST